MKDRMPMAVHVLLDCSGSMEMNRKNAVNAMNAFLEQMALSIMPASVTMSRFNSALVAPPMIADVPIYELPKLTKESYVIYGGTDIYRSTMSGIKVTEKANADTKVMVILTDGLSAPTLQKECQSLIRKRREEGWLFLFLGMCAEKDGYGTRYPEVDIKRMRKSMVDTANLMGILPEHLVVVPMDNLDAAMVEAALLCLDFKATGKAEFKKGK